jgi:hypothetical protein
MALGVAGFFGAIRVAWLTLAAVIVLPAVVVYLLISFRSARKDVQRTLYAQRNRSWWSLSIWEIACLMFARLFPRLFN